MDDTIPTHELELLILRAQAGDLDAFESIVRRFQDMAVGYAYSVLGDFHLAQDAAQEAFVEAYRDIARVYGAAVFPAWLRRITYKRCDRILRRKRPEVMDPSQVEAIPVQAKGPLEALEEQETRQMVAAAISGLSEEERQVTTLYHFGGYSYREIAAFMDLPTSTVDNRLRSSRRQLREKMAAAAPSRDEQFTHKVQLFNAAEAADMDKVRQLLNTDAARVALYDFLSERATEQGSTVEELVVRVIEQYKERAEQHDEETRVFRGSVDSEEKQESLRQIEGYLAEARFHHGAIIEIARLVPGATHNVSTIARCAWLASRYGYHTGSLHQIAQAASRSECERPELTTLAELVVRKLSETQVMVRLAEAAAGPVTTEKQDELEREIARLESTAEFTTLEKALEWQAAQGWAQVEGRLR